ncbi:MAG: hypothetical protein MZV49_24495 [Rhodopseudomonas palustris]|nr:hypothetical protein [Rhodopseudomonas palustris]
MLAIGCSAIAAARYQRHAFIAACVGGAGIGYALPGTVLALGLLTPLVLVVREPQRRGAARSPRRWATRRRACILVGLGAPRWCIAYAIRFPGGADRARLRPGWVRAHPQPDYRRQSPACSAPASATTAHRGALGHCRCARPRCSAPRSLVFVDCLKELPATLLLRPLNVETLATSIYQYASRGSVRGIWRHGRADRRRGERAAGDLADALCRRRSAEAGNHCQALCQTQAQAPGQFTRRMLALRRAGNKAQLRPSAARAGRPWPAAPA